MRATNAFTHATFCRRHQLAHEIDFTLDCQNPTAAACRSPTERTSNTMAATIDTFDPKAMRAMQEGNKTTLSNATLATPPLKLFNLSRFFGEGNGGVVNKYDETYTKKLRYQSEREFGLALGAKRELEEASAAQVARDQWRFVVLDHEAHRGAARAVFDAPTKQWKPIVDSFVEPKIAEHRRMHRDKFAAELAALKESRRGALSVDEYEASLSKDARDELETKAFAAYLARADATPLRDEIYNEAFEAMCKKFTWWSYDPAWFDPATGNRLPSAPLKVGKRKVPDQWAIYGKFYATKHREGMEFVAVQDKKASSYADLPASPANYARVLKELEADASEPSLVEWTGLDGKPLPVPPRTFTYRAPDGSVIERTAPNPYFMPYKNMDVYVSMCITYEPHVNPKNSSQFGIMRVFSPKWRIVHVEARALAAAAPAYAGIKRSAPLEVSAVEGGDDEYVDDAEGYDDALE